jgi:hypothetical protein
MKNKIIYTGVGALIFAIVILSLFAQFGQDIAAPPTAGGTFSGSLWTDYAWATVIISIIIFSGGVGVLKLVGGEFKWR